MTKRMAQFIPLTTAAAALVALSACSSVPQDGVIPTHLGSGLMNGSMSQMWSNVFTGELRRAPQPNYAFGASDATLNTPQLMNRLYASRQETRQMAHQQHYQPQRFQQRPAPQMRSYVPPQGYSNTMENPYISQEHSRIQPRFNPTPPRVMPQPQPQFEPQYQPQQELEYQPQSYQPELPQVQTPQKSVSSKARSEKRSFGSRLRSIFKSGSDRDFNQDQYENTTPNASAPQPSVAVNPPSIPAKSQPVLTGSQSVRDAYPVQVAAEPLQKTADYSIPPRASIDDNLSKTGRKTASYSPAVDQDWQTANEEISDSLSYVKMGGGSKISDWQACEKQAGNYFLPTAGGFTVAPKFDSCMRASGYMPEAEAQARLAAEAG